jgi:glycosyltransferase involved in cell wall biosynthesis
MKITIVGPASPLRGGIAHHTNTLSRTLAARHEVEVITFRRQYPSLLFPGTTQRESGGELVQIKTQQLLDSVNPWNWVKVALRIRRQNPDLVIFPYSLPFFAPCFGTVAAIVRIRRETRTLFLCHNILPHEHHPGDQLLARWAFRFGDCFVVQSEEVRRNLLRLIPGARHALVPHPVYDMFGAPIPTSHARQQLGIKESRVLLFFGYIRKYKGLGVLLEAFRLFLADQHNSLLLIVGEFYDDESLYRNQASALGISGAVRFVARYVPQNEVATYFSAADVVVLPYLSATQSGIAQIAYNFDRPLVATSAGGLGEVVQDGSTGFVVPPNDSPALAAALRRFYDERREEEFTRNVRQVKQKYSWQNLAQTVESLCL